MREVERIDRVLALLKKLWLECSDLRLGQIIELLKTKPGQDLFYIEDTQIEIRLNELLAKELKPEEVEFSFTCPECGVISNMLDCYDEMNYMGMYDRHYCCPYCGKEVTHKND